MHAGHGSGPHLLSLVSMVLFLGAVAGYGLAVLVSGRRCRSWPRWRTVLWLLGGLCCLGAVIGPVAERAHEDFPTHMLGHLLLGMLGPLLLVQGAPVTLTLRALPASAARRLVRVLGSWPLRAVSHPVVAGVADLGGVWLVYTTSLYSRLQQQPLLHLMVHAHTLIWGFLFTAAIVGVDPDRHRQRPLYRSVVLVVFMAGHGIVSKLVYAHPPLGVPTEQAELGAMVMYYGGDLVDLLLVVLLCRRWYVSTRPDRLVPRQAAASA